jgi:hypothetical protein
MSDYLKNESQETIFYYILSKNESDDFVQSLMNKYKMPKQKNEVIINTLKFLIRCLGFKSYHAYYGEYNLDTNIIKLNNFSKTVIQLEDLFKNKENIEHGFLIEKTSQSLYFQKRINDFFENLLNSIKDDFFIIGSVVSFLKSKFYIVYLPQLFHIVLSI